jgi:hypothetical protein
MFSMFMWDLKLLLWINALKSFLMISHVNIELKTDVSEIVSISINRMECPSDTHLHNSTSMWCLILLVHYTTWGHSQPSIQLYIYHHVANLEFPFVDWFLFCFWDAIPSVHPLWCCLTFERLNNLAMGFQALLSLNSSSLFILWRMGPLLSSGSVTSDRFWATAQ